MNAIEIFTKLSLPIKELKGEINAHLDSSEFEHQFRKLFSTPAAQSAKKCVYVWYTEKPIHRMKGLSDIIYIGKTDKSLYTRHARYAKKEANKENFARYDYIISNFGPIKVYYCECDNPKKRESELLEIYLQNHLELPPINRRS